jgi:RND family efflux transporter MFP subunit
MSKKAWVIGAVALLAVAEVAVAIRNGWSPAEAAKAHLNPVETIKALWNPTNAAAQAPRAPQGPRAVPVEVAKAEKKTVPVRIDALGTVTPIRSVAIKSRIETTIVGVHFNDGASVKEGELLFTLDSRQIEAQIKQVEAVMAGAKAQLEQAQRDVERQTELMTRNATTQVAVQNARTQVNIWRATSDSSAANLENLKVQLDYCTIRAPISGRASMAAVKVGNFVRPSDLAPLATINQIAPIYVSFAVPQRVLPDVRDAMVEGTAQADVGVPGDSKRATGRVSMVDNTVDVASGMVVIRATFENQNEILWPGTLVSTQLTLRVEEAVTVPTVAVQSGQSGTFVFVVKDGTAMVRPVTVARAMETESVISKGLSGDETVVTDGHLLLTNGVQVAPRQPRSRAGS